MTKCKYCYQEFDLSEKPKGWMANHTRWCDKNPKKDEYITRLSQARSNITEKSREKQREGIKRAWVEGRYSHVDHATFRGKTHTEESKQLMREKALASKHRRLKKGTVEYRGVLLDSSWELELAKRLDKLEITWVRPDPIPWIDESGITHNYFPDFYLPDYDMFLDPKNPQARKTQSKKLECLTKQYSNITIIDTLEECKNFSL